MVCEKWGMVHHALPLHLFMHPPVNCNWGHSQLDGVDNFDDCCHSRIRMKFLSQKQSTGSRYCALVGLLAADFGSEMKQLSREQQLRAGRHSGSETHLCLDNLVKPTTELGIKCIFDQLILDDRTSLCKIQFHISNEHFDRSSITLLPRNIPRLKRKQ